MRNKEKYIQVQAKKNNKQISQTKKVNTTRNT